ncbi:ABC transporter permease [Sulfurospirillum deleyianum]|uniref:ABC-2 type transporter n=1 Tax=Sulfurospirillum deleyianum (strain ATCC 51133 / DSM 6946 / 5175) TaxID=525898 RepID=D1B4V0_SULD5|nr:ABC transporter permease [Sulfurospirillum deleyianum]ACZ13120.1 ABC-2 type transporter [Sulfurospirillum deleyianum DSM 6946]
MLRHTLKKEFLLILRNHHALIVLFVMPTLFIIIMSLALQNTYANKYDVKLSVGVQSESNASALGFFMDKLNDNRFFTFNRLEENVGLEEALSHKTYDFVLSLSPNFIENSVKNEEASMQITSRSDIAYQQVAFLKQLLSLKMAELVIENFSVILNINALTKTDFEKKITHTYLLKDNKPTQITSVQHSVPSWLIFSMFFILIPISNTFINEKNFGTIDKIRSMNIPLSGVIVGKFIPYFVMNQLQVLLMILVGIYLLPLLGGDSLVIQGSFFMLLLISAVVSIAAISFALFIATLSNSSEMATILGGTSNIILAALGGIMVPKIVMPKMMQELSSLSPMSWALDSFLEIIVNGGHFSDIYPAMGKLLLCALFFLITAYFMLKYRRN